VAAKNSGIRQRHLCEPDQKRGKKEATLKKREKKATPRPKKEKESEELGEETEEGKTPYLKETSGKRIICSMEMV